MRMNPSELNHPSAVPALTSASSSLDSVLTIPEVAADLRCSRSHVYNILKNRVPGISPLPHIALGRKKLVRRAALEAWKRVNENNASATLGTEPVINTVDA